MDGRRGWVGGGPIIFILTGLDFFFAECKSSAFSIASCSATRMLPLSYVDPTTAFLLPSQLATQRSADASN